MKAWIGLIVIIFSFWVMIWGGNRDNDYTWYTRKYTVIEKNQGEHRYKGNYYDDYYLTLKYDDDPTHLWVKGVRGETYFAVKVNSRYLERDEKHEAFIILSFMLLFVAGVALLIWTL